MTPVKIIFFDIDGTLLDPATKRISQKTHEALKRLREKGILLCVATGRAPVAFPSFGDLWFDATCALNGTLCYTDKGIIYSNPIPRESVERVMENAAALGRPVSLALKDRLVANGYDQDLADYYSLSEMKLSVSDDFSTACREEVYQIMLGCREADHPAIIRDAKGVKIAVSWDRAVDVIPASGGKGTAIAKILAHFRLVPSQALAFGDSYNDFEMLQAVGTGVAMGNGAEPLKKIAHEVCLPVSQDGIYRYCIDHGLI